MGILYPYQQKWVSDRSRFKIGTMSRQIGKTFTTTLEATLDCLEAEAAGNRERWIILSRGQRQAEEAITEGCKRHLEGAKAEAGITGNLRLVADRDGGSHADRFWAGALCAAAAAGGKVEYAYEPLHNSQESNYDDFGDDDFGGHDQSSYLAAATTKGRATWH